MMPANSLADSEVVKVMASTVLQDGTFAGIAGTGTYTPHHRRARRGKASVALDKVARRLGQEKDGSGSAAAGDLRAASACDGQRSATPGLQTHADGSYAYVNARVLIQPRRPATSQSHTAGGAAAAEVRGRGGRRPEAMRRAREARLRRSGGGAGSRGASPACGAGGLGIMRSRRERAAMWGEGGGDGGGGDGYGHGYGYGAGAGGSGLDGTDVFDAEYDDEFDDEYSRHHHHHGAAGAAGTASLSGFEPGERRHSRARTATPGATVGLDGDRCASRGGGSALRRDEYNWARDTPTPAPPAASTSSAADDEPARGAPTPVPFRPPSACAVSPGEAALDAFLTDDAARFARWQREEHEAEGVGREVLLLSTYEMQSRLFMAEQERAARVVARGRMRMEEAAALEAEAASAALAATAAPQAVTSPAQRGAGGGSGGGGGGGGGSGFGQQRGARAGLARARSPVQTRGSHGPQVSPHRARARGEAGGGGSGSDRLGLSGSSTVSGGGKRDVVAAAAPEPDPQPSPALASPELQSEFLKNFDSTVAFQAFMNDLMFSSDYKKQRRRRRQQRRERKGEERASASASASPSRSPPLPVSRTHSSASSAASASTFSSRSSSDSSDHGAAATDSPRVWKGVCGDGFYKYERQYDHLRRLVNAAPTNARERIAKYWWAQSVEAETRAEAGDGGGGGGGGGAKSSASPLFDRLRRDAQERRAAQLVRALGRRERRQRRHLEELSDFLLDGVRSEMRQRGLRYYAEEIELAAEQEEEERGVWEAAEAQARAAYAKWREVRALVTDEEDVRLDTAEEERDARFAVADQMARDTPTRIVLHAAVGGDKPICTVCGYSLSARFCAMTGEPHAASTRCGACGLERFSNRFCAATGEPHDRLFTRHPTEGALAPPYRASGPSVGVRPLPQPAVFEALTAGLTAERMQHELRAMVAPKMVMDVCMDLHLQQNMPLPFLDVIYRDALGVLGVGYDETMLPSTIDELAPNMLSSSEEEVPAAQQADADDTKSTRSRKVRRASDARSMRSARSARSKKSAGQASRKQSKT